MLDAVFWCCEAVACLSGVGLLCVGLYEEWAYREPRLQWDQDNEALLSRVLGAA